jgi:hypothetical protein
MSEGIENKMYNYEVTPPTKVWENIAAALDECEMTHQFPSTLYGIERTPPGTTWEKIKNALDAEQEAAIPKHRKFSPMFRYAAAAAVIGLIAFGGFQLFKKQSGKKDMAKEQVVLPVKNNPVSDTTSASDEARNDSALKASEQIIARVDIPASIQKRSLGSNYISERVYLPGAGVRPDEEDNAPGLHDEETMTTAMAHEDIKNDNNSRYVMLMTPDGNIIRMSKKLCDLVCCVSGQEQDEGCKSQLKIWQEKMASSSVAPSPGNFMDILSLVNTLQEN